MGGWKGERDVEDETYRRRWMTSNSGRGVGSWQGNRLELQGSWLPSSSLWTLVDSRWSCTGWRQWMLTCQGAGWRAMSGHLASRVTCFKSTVKRGNVSLTPRGLFFSDRVDPFVTLGNRGLHSHCRGGEVRDHSCCSHHHRKPQNKTVLHRSIMLLYKILKYHWKITLHFHFTANCTRNLKSI